MNKLIKIIPNWIKHRIPKRIKEWIYSRQNKRKFPAPIYDVSNLETDVKLELASKRKYALLSYITRPFILSEKGAINPQFSNSGIARSIVKVLNEFDYIVDPEPSANKFIIKNSSGDNVASIDDKGNMYLRGTIYQSQSILSPIANSFIIQNISADNIAYFNNTGSLFLFGTITQLSDLSGITSTNLEFRNSTNDLVAFFDNLGNLNLQGGLNENYPSP